ncbi:LLM class flavin-dependent oxidoreductase (plasmid) [Mycobacterium intracellulare]|nr:LLM class flavin-dependent oxidoreductase [Mycobacterium intracellulare]MEE3755325.1 LLM class flavin-dependent oxidoreductase [Mycobacterium intracellulare]
MLTAKVTGIDSWWAADHLNALYPRSMVTPDHLGVAQLVPKIDAQLEPWTMLGYLASRNRFGGLRLGVGVTDASRRHPAVTAQAAATLNLLTRGRAILGMGVGMRAGNEPYGVDWTTPVGRFEEAVATIRALWNSGGSLVSRESPYFPLRDAVFDLPPYRGRWPEIWIAARGPRMLAVTGRYADAWFPGMVASPGDYAWGLDAVKAAASDAGRNPAAIIPALSIPVATGRNNDEIETVLSSSAAKALALGLPSQMWTADGVAHPFGDEFTGTQDLIPQTLDEQTVLSATKDVPASLLRRAVLTGTPDEVIDQAAEWRDHGVHYLVVNNISVLQPSLRKGITSGAPFVKILRGLRKL